MTSDVIVEELCGAISTIVSSALQDLSYDQTIICTIVDNSKSSNGEYRVTDGSTEFVAKSENTSYQKDDQVRVSILKGDMTQEKFIIGKYVNSDSNVPITYMSPLDSVMKMTDNLFTGKKDDDKPYGLYANGQKTLSDTNEWEPKRDQEILSTITLGDNQSSMINTQIYDTAYIQLDLKTLMSEYNIVSGHYGIGVSLGLVKDQKYVSSADYIFDSSQMLGNPYNFGIYTQQAAKFDIRSVGTINTIVVFWYQDGNFKHITHSDEAQYVESYTPNILAKNITIGFGSNVINVADDTVKLFSLDEEQYNGDDSEPERLRELKVAWYNKDDLGQSINFNDAVVSKEITDDNIIKTVKMGDSLIKFVDEYQYRELSETNNRRNAQIDYDIPMDVQGLELSAAIKKINEKLKSLSLTLSKDLHQIIEKFKARCNISVFTNYYEKYKVSEIINNQYISIDSTNTLPATIDTFFKNHMDALNRAAKKYNKVPSTVSSEGWTFKAETTDQPDNSWIEKTLLETYFGETLKDCLNNFLSNLKTKISSEYSGYMGIYDNYETKINGILDNVENQWKEIALILNSFNYPISETQNSTPQSLTNAVLSYWNDNYTFLQWTAQDLTKYENAYSVYWYRFNKLTTDSIAGKGWELIEKSYDANNVESSIDYTNYEQIKILLDPTKEKEEFKVLLFFNHRQHESNTIIFENTTDFNKQIADASNYIAINHGTNSHESYQSYSSTNTLLNGAEKYRSRELNISYTNHETGQIENNHLENAQIYWYIPKHSTMLSYDTNDLINLNDMNHFTNDLNSTIDDTDRASERQKSGYIMFYKTIKDLEKDLKFSYRIKDYYVPSATQNHILCDVVIDDVVYTSEILMNFSSYGTSGSDYTLVVSPNTSQAAITLNNKDVDSAWLLNITLYDSNNQEVDLSNKNVTIQTAKISDIVVNLINNHQIAAYIPEVKNANGQIVTPKILGDILEVIVTISKDATTNRAYDLTTYYSIPYSTDLDAFIEGASTIIYDSSGGFPTYYKNPYKYFNNNVEDTATKWSLTYSSNANSDTVSRLTPYMPKLENDNTLIPCNMWVKDCNIDGNTSYYECIQCYRVNEAGNITDLLWSQPLIIMQNRYPSPMLNKWDGSLKIDEENGTILSTTVGAGKKNSDNSFSGILMGDVSDAAAGNYTGMGLYGFYHGKQSFGFNVDGTAFLGEANGGRITFDGNKGLIKSQSYDNKLHSGMSIDIDDGVIDIKGGCYDYDENGDIKKDENGNILYNENQKPSRIIINSKSPYFEIISKNNKSLMKVSDKDYYLKSDNFNDTNEGTKFNLQDGSLVGYNFTLKALSNNNGVILSSKGTDEEPYFAIKRGGKNLLYADDNEFYLKSEDENLNFNIAEGFLTATNFILSAGNIILSSGGKNPYLDIKALNGKSILYVDEEDYYLQSSNFSNEETEGVQLNLNNGSFIGYDFTLKALSANGAGIILQNNKDLYFQVKAKSKDSNGNNWNLLTISEEEFTLQAPDPQIMNIDIANGSIHSTNFSLTASSGPSDSPSAISINSGKYNQDEGKIEEYLSFLIQAQGKPLIRIRDGENDDNQIFTLSSKDWRMENGDTPGEGTLINLKSGSIHSYNFDLKAGGKIIDENGTEKTAYIILNSKAEQNPFNVNNKFKIDWDGSLDVNGKFKVANNGSLTICDSADFEDYPEQLENQYFSQRQRSFNVDSHGNVVMGYGKLRRNPNIIAPILKITNDGTIGMNYANPSLADSDIMEPLFEISSQSGLRIGTYNEFFEKYKYPCRITQEGKAYIAEAEIGAFVLSRNWVATYPNMILDHNDEDNNFTYNNKPIIQFTVDGEMVAGTVTPRDKETGIYPGIQNILFKINSGGKMWAKDFSLDKGTLQSCWIKNNVRFSNDTVNYNSLQNQSYFCQFDSANIYLNKSQLILSGGTESCIMLDNTVDFYSNASITLRKNVWSESSIVLRGKQLLIKNRDITIGSNGIDQDSNNQDVSIDRSTTITLTSKTIQLLGNNISISGPVTADQFAEWITNRNAYTYFKGDIEGIDGTVTLATKDTSLKVYITMLIITVLDKLGLLKQATSNNGNGYENAQTFAKFMGASQIDSDYNVYAPFNK